MPKHVSQIDPITREFVGFATAFENPTAARRLSAAFPLLPFGHWVQKT